MKSTRSSMQMRGIFKGLVWLLVLAATSRADDAVVNWQEKDVNLGSQSVHYRMAGTGPCLLFLHGFTLTGEEWMSIAESFAEEYTVVLPDLPGHGLSTPVDSVFDFNEAATRMFGLIDSLGIERFDAIGHSAGAITLLHMATQGRDRIRAMILVGGGHRFAEAGREDLIASSYTSLDSSTLRFYLQLHPGGRAQVKSIFDLMNLMGADRGWSRDLEPKLSFVSTSVLLVNGERDMYFDSSISSELQKLLPDCRLWVIPEQGHSPLWEMLGGSVRVAAEFEARARDFLGEK